MNTDPSLCRLIANPHRLKKNEIKITSENKGKEHLSKYIRSEYHHLYITPMLLSDLDEIIRDYIFDYEIERVCEDIIKRVIQNTIRDASTVIGFDPVDHLSETDEIIFDDDDNTENADINDSYESSDYETDIED